MKPDVARVAVAAAVAVAAEKDVVPKARDKFRSMRPIARKPPTGMRVPRQRRPCPRRNPPSPRPPSPRPPSLRRHLHRSRQESLFQIARGQANPSPCLPRPWPRSLSRNSVRNPLPSPPPKPTKPPQRRNLPCPSPFQSRNPVNPRRPGLKSRHLPINPRERPRPQANPVPVVVAVVAAAAAVAMAARPAQARPAKYRISPNPTRIPSPLNLCP